MNHLVRCASGLVLIASLGLLWIAFAVPVAYAQTSPNCSGACTVNSQCIGMSKYCPKDKPNCYCENQQTCGCK